MNGPIRMYRTRQIVRHDIAVELPQCMYTLKNIHPMKNGMVASTDHVSSSAKKLDIFDQNIMIYLRFQIQNNHNIPGMAELEAKQEDILKQLAELKKQIISIKSDLKISPVQPKKRCISSSMTTFSRTEADELPVIVINASPTNPPYSLEIVQRLLRNVITLIFSVHLHSSVSSLPEGTKQLEKALVNFSEQSNTPKVNVRLIWKKQYFDSTTELLVSHVPIRGEANLLRYLSRAIRSPLTYDSEPDCIEIDSLLDICYLIVRARTKTERTNLLQMLNKSLGKSQWLLGRGQASVADLAAYSAIKQASNASEISANLGKWFQRCETVLLCH
ncbi:hypothetical protein NQ317_016783 [Molorchus minor]|uniref:Aminoacyl tRNA synthase complex-interacting multifunctional protein 2 n=1 Tax=Molorchus minor TaxID=1323400 RepID=A0ABQ9IY33_9CUCU|nr:hypothetical protein NQ317_016783 [Molorchus minor]